MSPARIGPIPALALSLVFLVGCSDDSPSPSPPSSTASKTTAPAPGTASAGSFKACDVVTAPEIDLIVDFDVITTELPGGCQFGEQGNPQGISILVGNGILAAASDGLRASKAGSLSAYEGDAKDLRRIGDNAYVVVGKLKSSSKNTPQGQGAVQIGDQYVLVTLTQFEGEPAAEIERIVTETLKLIAEKL